MPAELARGYDSHTHLIPPPIVEEARSGGFDMEVSNDHLITPAARIPLGKIGSPDLLEAWVSDNALAGAIVSPPPPLFQVASHDSGGWSEYLNGALLETCDERLRPLAFLPAHEPDVAYRIIARIDHRFAGAVMGTNFGVHLPSDPVYNDVWEGLVDRDLPLLIHPEASDDARLKRFYLANLVGNPLETTIVAAHLVLGGVLTRHRDLNVILAHGGGAVAQLAGRWDWGFSAARPGLQDLEENPSDILRRVYVDSVVHSQHTLQHVRSTFGDDHVLFGSDWPFPMGVDSIAPTVDGWESGRLVMAENSRRLFGSDKPDV